MKFQSLEKLVGRKQISSITSILSDSDRKHILKKADELLNQTFVFDKTWDMERCLTPYHFDEMDWNSQRNDDEEWCFMLARMDYLNYLLLASLITKDNCYAKKAKFYILDWISKHEEIVFSPSTRTLDTGIRVMNIFECLPYLYFLNELSENEFETIKNSLIKQMEYLKQNYITKYITSNWGSIQTCAIVSVLPFLISNICDNELYIWAKKELELQFSIQVYPDGMHWEQSTMYHVEVLNYAMKAIYYLSLADESIPDILISQAKSLAKALLLQLTPSGSIETFGDSDRVFANDVFTRAAILFSNEQFKFAGYDKPDIETLYTVGACAYDLLNKIKAKQPDSLVFDGIDSGMYTVRSSWDKNASFTMFTNGSLGSGHGHSDNLHFSLYHLANEILIDTGRYTYREDHPLRTELKSMKSHNSVLIDENEYCKPSDSWGYSDFGLPLKNYVRHINNLHYFEGSIIGHNPLQIWTRKLIVISPDIWLICDELKCDGKHNSHMRFHFDPKCNLKLHENDIHITSNNSKLKMQTNGKLSIESKPCSFFYNQKVMHPVLSAKSEFENNAEYITTICNDNIKVENVPVYQNGNEKTDCSVAQARKFIINDNESYTIAVYHKEIYKGKKILSCEGVYYHAKCVVIHENNGEKNLFILKA